MAYLKEIDRKCQRGDCASGAVVQVIAEDFSVVGDYCRPHGREEQKAQDARDKEKEKGKAKGGQRLLEDQARAHSPMRSGSGS